MIVSGRVVTPERVLDGSVHINSDRIVEMGSPPRHSHRWSPRGLLAGVHFEGPYLSPDRRGAHGLEQLREPSTEELAELVALGGGAVRMVTLAPERPGALAAIRWLVEAGVVAAIGHTYASYEQTRSAVAAGATVATHLCNGGHPRRAGRPAHRHRHRGAKSWPTTRIC